MDSDGSSEEEDLFVNLDDIVELPEISDNSVGNENEVYFADDFSVEIGGENNHPELNLLENPSPDNFLSVPLEILELPSSILEGNNPHHNNNPPELLVEGYNREDVWSNQQIPLQNLNPHHNNAPEIVLGGIADVEGDGNGQSPNPNTEFNPLPDSEYAGLDGIVDGNLNQGEQNPNPEFNYLPGDGYGDIQWFTQGNMNQTLSPIPTDDDLHGNNPLLTQVLGDDLHGNVPVLQENLNVNEAQPSLPPLYGHGNLHINQSLHGVNADYQPQNEGHVFNNQAPALPPHHQQGNEDNVEEHHANSVDDGGEEEAGRANSDDNGRADGPIMEECLGAVQPVGGEEEAGRPIVVGVEDAVEAVQPIMEKGLEVAVGAVHPTDDEVHPVGGGEDAEPVDFLRWAKDPHGTPYSLVELRERGITTIEGQIICRLCGGTFTRTFNLEKLVNDFAIFLPKCRGGVAVEFPHWMEPPLLDCDLCHAEHEAAPVIPPENQHTDINWLFLMATTQIGRCHWSQMVHFCRKRGIKVYPLQPLTNVLLLVYSQLYKHLVS